MLRMAPQTLIGCFKAQSSDEEIPQLFGLLERLRFRHDGSGGGEDFNDAFLVASMGRKLDSILKSRDINLPTKVRLVKAMVFPVVMYGCENWTIKKAEH